MTTATKAKPIERVDMDELKRILEHAKASLSEEDHRNPLRWERMPELCKPH